jgi:hypothetical protein
VDTELVFLFLLIAPVLTLIAPIRASNAHGRSWITDAGLRIRYGHNRHWHYKAERSHAAAGRLTAARAEVGSADRQRQRSRELRRCRRRHRVDEIDR